MDTFVHGYIIPAKINLKFSLNVFNIVTWNLECPPIKLNEIIWPSGNLTAKLRPLQQLNLLSHNQGIVNSLETASNGNKGLQKNYRYFIVDAILLGGTTSKFMRCQNYAMLCRHCSYKVGNWSYVFTSELRIAVVTPKDVLIYTDVQLTV
jgi:hypothetical protein